LVLQRLLCSTHSSLLVSSSRFLFHSHTSIQNTSSHDPSSSPTTLTAKMAFITHPQMSTYPGASFQTPWNPSNYNGPHLAQRSGGNSQGYWAHVPWEVPEPTPWGLPPAVTAAMEGRGTGVWGMTMQGGGQPFNYGWPKYGPVRFFIWWMGRELIVDAFETGFGWLWYVHLSLSFILTPRDFLHDCLRGGMLITIVGKTNPFGRSFPHGFYKTPY
jgi:hypothetical protein